MRTVIYGTDVPFFNEPTSDEYIDFIEVARAMNVGTVLRLICVKIRECYECRAGDIKRRLDIEVIIAICRVQP